MSGREQGTDNERMRRIFDVDKSTLSSDGGPGFNRLIFASSPYLLQHADNPVDWYPWGEEAFAKARSEDKPVFVSIGYATCHWCHVMAHESFEVQEIADVFNRSFVCIKVDREERPDIDGHYMAVAQMMTGSGGWPLNIFMTPEKRPFYATTYIPPTGRMGMPGIIQVLEKLAAMWRTERQRLEESSGATIEALTRLFQARPGDLPDLALEESACRVLTEMYDGFWGGFGNAPKFPMPLYLSFLLRWSKRERAGASLAMADNSLRMMRQGGVYDQIGFGFHRYSVDRQWLVPHFEKMLYDQALIAIAYLEAFQATGAPFHRQVAEELFTYVLREMCSPEGGFYSGQDADTEGVEGKYYLWTPAEIAAVIGTEDAELFGRLFDISVGGNFEGSNIPHLLVPTETFALSEGVDSQLLTGDLERWRLALLAAREQRPRPFRDEKVLTSWNGLMIAALAKGYAVTGDGRYLAAAARAASHVCGKLFTPAGRLLRSHHQGKASIPAFLDDYAFFVWGLIELHQVTLDTAFLEGARTLAGEMLRLFGSGGAGGLYETGSDGEQLPVRELSAYDGALPSGNSVAAWDFFRLGRIVGDDNLSTAGEAIVQAFMGDANRQPLGAINLLAAYDYHLGPEVTVTLSGQKDDLHDMLFAVHRRFIPRLALRFGATGDGGEFPALGGLPTAYVCAGGACLLPVTEVAELDTLLDKLCRNGQ